MGDERSDRTAMLTAVNRTILGAASVSPSEAMEWDFFCECGRDECREQVALSLDAYLGIRARDGVVLARGHLVSEVQSISSECL